MLLLAGCAAADTPERDTTPSPSAASVPATSTPEPEAVEPAEPQLKIDLPDGYPQVVDVSTIPAHMQGAFNKGGETQAVAVADGVWAQLPPGATPEDAVNAMIFDGYCASKEAFEREYLGGQSTAGTCW